MRHLKFCYISILIYIYTSLVALLSYGRTYIYVLGTQRVK